MNTIDWNRELALGLRLMVELYERSTTEDPGSKHVQAYRQAKRTLERYEAYGELGARA